jgi:hypothetical protein
MHVIVNYLFTLTFISRMHIKLIANRQKKLCKRSIHTCKMKEPYCVPNPMLQRNTLYWECETTWPPKKFLSMSISPFFYAISWIHFTNSRQRPSVAGRGLYMVYALCRTLYRPRNERKKQQRISTMTLCASEREIVAGIMIIATDYDM